MRKAGYYETIGTIKCFIPYPLPPYDPKLKISTKMSALSEKTMHNLGKLNGMIGSVPDIKRFIHAYVTKEALLSSEIEGIHTTLLELFTQPLLSSKPHKNTQLVMNYKKAVDYATLQITKKNMPISTRIILKTHELLMSAGAGEKSNPGHYRKQAVRVGNLMPPPFTMIPKLMGHLEEFINMDATISPLIKAGLAHVQFETIHPFLDGNGRIGRLLIVLMLVNNKLLDAPILYPSYYFKKQSLEYYRALDRVRTHGDFEQWVMFYLNVINDSSIDAYLRAKDIEKLRNKLTKLIIDQDLSEKMQTVRLKAIAALFSFPITRIGDLQKKIKTSYNTARQIMYEFIELGIVRTDKTKKRGKLFLFSQYLAVLDKEYDV